MPSWTTTGPKRPALSALQRSTALRWLRTAQVSLNYCRILGIIPTKITCMFWFCLIDIDLCSTGDASCPSNTVCTKTDDYYECSALTTTVVTTLISSMPTEQNSTTEGTNDHTIETISNSPDNTLLIIVIVVCSVVVVVSVIMLIIALHSLKKRQTKVHAVEDDYSRPTTRRSSTSTSTFWSMIYSWKYRFC